MWASLDVMPWRRAPRPSATGRSVRRACSASPGRRPGPEPEPLVRGPAWTDRQRLEYEKEVLGFYVTGIPLSAVSQRAPRTLRRHDGSSDGRGARTVATCAQAASSRPSARRARGADALMAFATLEDLEGSLRAGGLHRALCVSTGVCSSGAWRRSSDEDGKVRSAAAWCRATSRPATRRRSWSARCSSSRARGGEARDASSRGADPFWTKRPRRPAERDCAARLENAARATARWYPARRDSRSE